MPCIIRAASERQVSTLRSVLWSKAFLCNMPDDREITETIIGAAYTVLNKLKPGLDEKPKN